MNERYASTDQEYTQTTEADKGLSRMTKVGLWCGALLVVGTGLVIGAHEYVDMVNEETQYQLDHPVRG